jgi:hypothetical protein
MNVLRSFIDWINPSNKQKRLMLEDFENFKNHLEENIKKGRLNPKIVVKTIGMLNDKRNHYPEDDTNLQLFEIDLLTKELHIYLNFLILKLYHLYIKSLLEKNKNSKSLLKGLQTLVKTYELYLDKDTLAIYGLLKNTKNYIENESTIIDPKIPFFLSKYFEDKNFFELEQNLFGSHSLETLNQFLIRPVDYYQKRKIIFEKLLKSIEIILDLLEYTLYHSRLVEYNLINIEEHYKLPHKLMREDFSEWKHELTKLITDTEKLLQFKKLFDKRILLFDQHYNSIIDYFGEDFAVHGTDIYGAINIIDKGMVTTTARGGANFKINGYAGTYGIGENKCFIITKIKYIIKSTLSQNPKFEFHDSESKRILEYHKFLMAVSINGKLHNHEDNFKTIKTLFPNKKNIVLEVKGGQNPLIKVPWVILPYGKQEYNILFEKYQNEKAIKVISHDGDESRELEKIDSFNAKTILNKHLK